MPVAHELKFAGTEIRVTLTSDVISVLLKQRQISRLAKERGGQLFGTIHENEVVVVEATGARRGDRATRVSYMIHRAKAQADIYERHNRGLHFLGDWHTHPEDAPRPSERDVSNISLLFDTSKHELNRILMLIVGTSFPSSWWCSIHDARYCERISAPEAT